MPFPEDPVVFFVLWALVTVPCSVALLLLAPVAGQVGGFTVLTALLAGGLHTTAGAMQ